jgi:hypothetical protein
MRWALFISILVVAPGCTSVALKRATLSHARSSTDLRYREVIENLAMSAANPDILPAYSSIYAGTTDVNDSIKATSTSVWARTLLQHPLRFTEFFSTETADFIGSRAVKSNWTLDPTVVPEKLRAMQAACQWVTIGPENVGPNVRYLMAYRPAAYKDDPKGGPNRSPDFDPSSWPSENGYYFDVIDRLAELPQGWLHREQRRCDIPRDACYSAGSGDTFVWVGPEGMAALSEFVLILQKIARVQLPTAYYPRTQTRMIQKNFGFHEGADDFIAAVTFYLDEKGILTTAANTPAIPVKKRIDNVGTNSDLKSVINASAKSASQ